MNRSLPFVVAMLAGALTPLIATAAQRVEPQPDAMTIVTGPEESGPSGDCGCRGGQQAWQQPPWHGNVRGYQCGQPQACCRGSNVFQAQPFQQLQWKHSGCVTLPPHLPRLHAMCREGYLPSPVSPALPRCHQCGAPIEGGF